MPNSAAHVPLKTLDGPNSAGELVMGDPADVALSQEIEALILNEQSQKQLSQLISPSAAQAAREAYAQGVFNPLWTVEAAQALLMAIPRLQDHGLTTELTESELRAIINQRFEGSSLQKAVGDLKLTATWLILTEKISGGLSDEGGMIKSTEARPTRSDLIVGLIQAAKKDPIKVMEHFASTAPQYGALKSALKQYRDYAEANGWMKIRNDGELLKPGMTDPRIAALRKRLDAEGFFDTAPIFRSYAALETPDSASDPNLYDDRLATKIKAFQAAHKLTQDGILGPSTLNALNESVASKIKRIKTAMDYWRYNDDLGPRYIWVNIPSYRAEAWTGDRRDIAMETIVGKDRTPTVAFEDEIEYIVVNPKWFLPIGLFKRQKLRKLRKDPAYAEKHNYVVYDRASGDKLDPYQIDWSESGIARRIQMVQTPGPHNALGQLKIIFPNKHAIYLHDTPARHLFDRDVRALSSGCIRLDDPVKMANWLTDGDVAVSTHVFNETLASGDRDRFYLDQHVNVRLTYLPATVDPDGNIEFPRDIYQGFEAPAFVEELYPDTLTTEIEDDLYVGMNMSRDYSVSNGAAYR